MGDAEEAARIDLAEDDLRQVARHELALAVEAAHQRVEEVRSVGQQVDRRPEALGGDALRRPEEVDRGYGVGDAAQGVDTVCRDEVGELPVRQEDEDAEDGQVERGAPQEEGSQDEGCVEGAEDGARG